MARVKTVYSPDMVCHLWANRHAHNVRNATANIYNEGGTLYSYGRHHAIATFLDNPAKGGTAAIVWNDNTYGQTTARHHSMAWRALSTAQRAAVIRVPDLRDDVSGHVPSLERLAAECVKAAVSPLEKSDKARQARDGYISAAAAWFNSARALYAYTGNTKAGAAVPTIPDNADKAAIKAVLLSINRAEYLKAAAAFDSRAIGYFASAEYNAQCGNYRTAAKYAIDSENTAKRAAAEYIKAGAKVPKASTAAAKRAAAFIAEHAAACRREVVAEHAANIKTTERGIMIALAGLRRPVNRVPGAAVPRMHSETSFQWAIERMEWPAPDIYAELWANPKERAIKAAQWAAVRGRVYRLIASQLLTAAIERARADLSSYMQSVELGGGYSVPSDNVSYRARQYAAAYAMHGGKPSALILERAAAAIADIKAISENHAARMAERNAAKIAEWRAGGRVSVPRDIPPMVRIVGDILETSHGASVPVPHAVRLIDIARRAAERGGADYESGTGPKVGHFTVTNIGADMSAVIGCHTFTSEEGQHAAALIDAYVIKNLQGALMAKVGK